MGDYILGREPTTYVYGKLYGWRAFIWPPSYTAEAVPLGTLLSPHTKVVLTNPLVATCGSGGTSHEAPVKGCTCGIYVYATLKELERNISQYTPPGALSAAVSGRRDWDQQANKPNKWVVWALVEVEGRAVPHEHGVRAQQVRLNTLFTALDDTYIAAIAERYQVPVRPVKALKDRHLPQVSGKVDVRAIAIPAAEATVAPWQPMEYTYHAMFAGMRTSVVSPVALTVADLYRQLATQWLFGRWNRVRAYEGTSPLFAAAAKVPMADSTVLEDGALVHFIASKPVVSKGWWS